MRIKKNMTKKNRLKTGFFHSKNSLMSKPFFVNRESTLFSSGLSSRNRCVGHSSDVGFGHVSGLLDSFLN